MADEFVTVASYNTSVEASMAKNCLAQAGVRAYLTDDTTVDMAWYLGTALGGVKLQVKACDAERAEQILAAPHEASEARTRLPESGARVALATGGAPELVSEEVAKPAPNLREQTARRAVRAAVMGLVLVPLQRIARRFDPVLANDAVLGLLLLPLELYVFWLLIRVVLSDEPLTPETRRLATIAACINLPFIALCCWLLGQFL